jgi:hypothetical protein
VKPTETIRSGSISAEGFSKRDAALRCAMKIVFILDVH